MPNHFHLFLRQAVDSGISRFMQKLGTGYTMYFNQKHDRVGGLFQGGFKAARIERESHFLYLPHYIHLNPLDLYMPSWRDGRIIDPHKVFKFLESYRWSSYLDHTGKKNFPSIISSAIFKHSFGTPKEYRVSFREWIDDMNFTDLSDIIIEKPWFWDLTRSCESYEVEPRKMSRKYFTSPSYTAAWFCWFCLWGRTERRPSRNKIEHPAQILP